MSTFLRDNFMSPEAFNELVNVGDQVLYFPCKCPVCRLIARRRPVRTLSAAYRTETGFMLVEINRPPYVVNLRQVRLIR